MSDAKKKTNDLSVLDAFAPLADFSRVLLDAYALVDCNGKVVKANQLFSQLTGIKMKQILKVDNFDTLLSFSINGENFGIEALLGYDIPTRIDEVQGCVPEDDDYKNLILGVYPLYNDNKSIKLGSFVTLRDVTAETALQDKYKSKAIQSITDPLSSLFTRGYFEEYLTGQVTRMEQTPPDHRISISLLMCDIDFFKKVNDVHGHQAGDYVIKTVGELMRGLFRKTDICCRYGGEEFLVILPGTNLENAAIAGNKLRKKIENSEFIFEGTKIPITISIGVATVDIGNEAYKETMARADGALYESKNKGRNKVCIHDGKAIKPT